jgi:hypothetical protein
VSKTILLARTFFARFFESDLLPPGLPQVQLIVWSMALLAGPGLLMPMFLSKRYPQLEADPAQLAQALFGDRLIFITLGMTSMGFVALVLWQNVFPDKRDARLLGVLPLTERALVAGRLLALSMLAGVFVIGINAIPTVTYGPLVGYYGGAANVLLGAVAYLAATASGGVFVFFTLVTAQALCLNAGRSFADRFAPALQVLFIFALFLQLFFLPRLMASLGADLARVAADPVLRNVPFAWFLGLADTVGGRPGPGSLSLAGRAMLATVGMVGASFGLLALTHGRLMRMALEGRETKGRAGRTRRSILTPLVAVACRGATERAIFEFTVRTLLRSRSHRMLLAIYLGVALAMMSLSVAPLIVRDGLAGLAQPRAPLLAVPLIFFFFMLIGVSVMIAIPVEPKANWIFRLLEPADRVAAISGLRNAMLALIVAPVTLVAATVGTFAWGPWPALVHGLVCASMGWLLCELLLARVRRLPFTCTYFPGRTRMQMWPIYVLAFSNYCFTTAVLELGFIASAGRLATFLLAVSASIAVLTLMRARRLADPPGLRFEEEDPEAVFEGFSLSEGLAARAPAAISPSSQPASRPVSRSSMPRRPPSTFP